MVKNKLKIEGERLYLRPVKISDARPEYVRWLNNREINQFLEIRFIKHTLQSLTKYIAKVSRDKNIIFLAIILKDGDKHIGNIKLGPIDRNHKLAEIGIMIGDKESWGKGYATETIKLLTEYAFDKLKLHKITAGAYENNIGSIKAFLKRGFYEEGRRKKHFLHNGKWVDDVLLARINPKL
jgi:RimJ/RimL family protein N-acetyltransferase